MGYTARTAKGGGGGDPCEPDLGQQSLGSNKKLTVRPRKAVNELSPTKVKVGSSSKKQPHASHL